MKVYLDNNATTPVDPRVVEAMRPYWSEIYGNASSLHGFGRDAEDAVAVARGHVARALGARAEEIVFTSGGTESDNLALLGVLTATRDEKPHLVTTAIEHPAVLRAAEALDEAGACELTIVPVGRDGIIDPDDVRRALAANTRLVSVMAVNNETGVLQPIEDIATICREREILLHTDAVQALGKIPFDAVRVGADLVTVSAHKLYGPKGVGALRVGRGVRLRPIINGGEQQHGLRSGTLPVALIVGFGEAVRLSVEDAEQRADTMRDLDDMLLGGLEERVSGMRLNGSRDLRVPGVINVHFPGTTGDALLIQLDQAGIAVSTGSACGSGSPRPSHVLTAMGMSRDAAQASVRLSLSPYNLSDEVTYVLDTLPKCVARLRSLSGAGRRR
jgi:cysteine desulfurase